jgi:DNA-directed RNA polymerase specialized sigma24 family protein
MTYEEGMTMKPTTVEDAAALISLNPIFISKAQSLVRNNLGSHIKSSNEYVQIAEEAVSVAVLNLLKIIKCKGKDWPLYGQAITSYGTKDCLTTRYLYKSVRRYTTTRQYFWGKDKETGIPRYKARLTGPSVSNQSEGQSHDDWLETLLESNNSNQKALDQQLSEIIDALTKSETSSEIIEIVKMRGEGKTFIEIAEQHNTSKDAVRMKFNRVKSTLLEMLEL